MSEGAQVYSKILEVGEKHGIRELGGRTKMVNHVEACYPTPGVDYAPAWGGIPEEAEFRRFIEEAGIVRFNFDRVFNHSGSHQGNADELYFSPYEMGWGRSVKFDHEFVGKEALEAEAENPRRVMRTLVWNAEDVGEVLMSFFKTDEEPYKFMEWPREYLGRVVADQVLDADGSLVGLATSRCYSYYFREMLSLAVIDVDRAEPGTEVTVIWGDVGQRQKQIRATVAAAPYKTDRRRTELKRPE